MSFRECVKHNEEATNGCSSCRMERIGRVLTMASDVVEAVLKERLLTPSLAPKLVWTRRAAEEIVEALNREGLINRDVLEP